MSNPFLQLLGKVSNSEGLLKETLLRIQEGSTFEVLNNLVFFTVDKDVLSMFDWIMPFPSTVFIVAKMLIIDDIMKSGGKDRLNRDVNMCQILKSLLFKEICHINTTNQPFPSIYSDDKKWVLDSSLLSPLSYEESFEIQMIRCYIRLLPDTPFLLFYNENHNNYWMIQSFNGAQSTTITIQDHPKTLPIDSVSSTLAHVQPSSETENVVCTTACVLTSSSSLHSLHSQLLKQQPDSFVMLFSSFPVTSSICSETTLSIPLTTSSDLLIRYSPRPYTELGLEADLLYQQFDMICKNHQSPSTWIPLNDDVKSHIEISTDYTERIYYQTLSCSSFESVLSSIHQLLTAIPTYDTLPSLSAENTTDLAQLIKEAGDEFLANKAFSDSFLSSWMERVNQYSKSIDQWVSIAFFSLTCQIQNAYTKYGLISEEKAPSSTTLSDWKDWLNKRIRVLGVIGLIESSIPLSQADLQNCLQIIEKPVFTTPSACMLLTLPQNIAAKAYPIVSLPDIISIKRKRKNGHEKKLDLNEVETEEMDLLMNKEMMKEHYRIQEEVDAIEQCICDHCGKAVAEKAIHCYEERNEKQTLQQEYSCVHSSIKSGAIGF